MGGSFFGRPFVNDKSFLSCCSQGASAFGSLFCVVVWICSSSSCLDFTEAQGVEIMSFFKFVKSLARVSLDTLPAPFPLLTPELLVCVFAHSIVSQRPLRCSSFSFELFSLCTSDSKISTDMCSSLSIPLLCQICS